MKKPVAILEQTAQDIEHGMDFYNTIEAGVGDYYRDSIISDIRRLALYMGLHRIHFGFHRVLASRFPYAIYYVDTLDLRQIVAVMDLRRDPEWIRKQLLVR